jgi:hypothetical protein
MIIIRYNDVLIRSTVPESRAATVRRPVEPDADEAGAGAAAATGNDVTRQFVASVHVVEPGALATILARACPAPAARQGSILQNSISAENCFKNIFTFKFWTIFSKKHLSSILDLVF